MRKIIPAEKHSHWVCLGHAHTLVNFRAPLLDSEGGALISGIQDTAIDGTEGDLIHECAGEMSVSNSDSKIEYE